MNLKVGDKVRIKSKEWYEACKCIYSTLPVDITIFDFFHIGEIGKIERICGDLILTNFNDGGSAWFSKGWIEPMSYGSVNMPKDTELKKTVTVNMPNDLDVSTVEYDGKITINIQHKEEKVEKQKFKNGDIIYVQERAGGYIAIFQNMWDDVIDVHASLCLKTGLIYTNLNGKEILHRKNILSIIYATKEEKKELFDKLAKQKQLYWNAEELKFEEYRWRAERGEKYWRITDIGTMVSSIDFYSPFDNILYNLRNYFQTEELAKQALPKLKEFYKNLNIK